MNPTYRNIVLARVKNVIAQAEAVRTVGHRGLKGALRETLLRDLFRPLFPSDLGAGTGEIVTHAGQKSRQQDVVIFNRGILPPILYEDSSGIFPIESVLYSIEVKSTLTNGEMRKSHKSASLLNSFQYLSGIYDGPDQPLRHNLEPVARALFAFDSDASSPESERCDRLRLTEAPQLAAICVVGKGYWYWSNVQNGWVSWDMSYEFEEVVGFVAGVMNSLAKIGSSRGTPRLGNYLI